MGHMGGIVGRVIVRWGRTLVAGACCVAVLGCRSQSIVNSFPGPEPVILKEQDQYGGSYYLPKHVIKATVTGTPKAYQIAIETRAIADRKALLQIGYDLSAFSSDDIKVD